MEVKPINTAPHDRFIICLYGYQHHHDEYWSAITNKLKFTDNRWIEFSTGKEIKEKPLFWFDGIEVTQ